jgi:hypothetical protein
VAEPHPGGRAAPAAAAAAVRVAENVLTMGDAAGEIGSYDVPTRKQQRQQRWRLVRERHRLRDAEAESVNAEAEALAAEEWDGWIAARQTSEAAAKEVRMEKAARKEQRRVETTAKRKAARTAEGPDPLPSKTARVRFVPTEAARGSAPDTAAAPQRAGAAAAAPRHSRPRAAEDGDAGERLKRARAAAAPAPAPERRWTAWVDGGYMEGHAEGSESPATTPGSPSPRRDRDDASRAAAAAAGGNAGQSKASTSETTQAPKTGTWEYGKRQHVPSPWKEGGEGHYIVAYGRTKTGGFADALRRELGRQRVAPFMETGPRAWDLKSATTKKRFRDAVHGLLTGK